MTSILNNAGAISALQTLRSINSSMATTQGRISSGMRVQTAADNAAYWSIATTMKSDNKSISAVSDALGMGLATVDTAYTSLEAVIEVLSEFKSKLVASKEPGVDHGKIQKELDQLKQQVVSISKSATFSGGNWLDVDVDLDTSKTSILSAFVRKGDGSVSVETMTAVSSDFALFNRTGGAILQARYDRFDPTATPVRSSLGDLGGLLNASIIAVDQSTIRYPGVFVTWPVTFGSSDTVSFDVTANASVYGPGQTQTIVIDRSTINATLGRSDGVIPDHGSLKSVLDAALQAKAVPIYTNASIWNGSVSVQLYSSLSSDIGESIAVSNVSSTLGGGFSFGIDQIPFATHNNSYAKDTFGFSGAFRVADGASFSFDMGLPIPGNSGPLAVTHYVVTLADVENALPGSAGIISTAGDLAKVLSTVTSGAGLLFTADGNSIEITADVTIRPHQGLNSFFSISTIRKFEAPPSSSSTPGDDLTTFDFLSIDIESATGSTDSYIASIEDMLTKTTDAAATLGSLQSRITMQSSFATVLMDAVKRGVARLVDADMNEESTRLKAIQTQKQLGIQALQIANSNSETIIQLFR